jgi:hypothetical protein
MRDFCHARVSNAPLKDLEREEKGERRRHKPLHCRESVKEAVREILFVVNVI